MRSFLLAAALMMACVSGSFAQNLPPVYNWEVGVNGGYSVMTRPLGPPEGYQGTRSNVVHDLSLRATYYFNWHWMLSLDLGVRRWETFGQWDVNDKFGSKLAPNQISFLYADKGITESAQFNYVIPFYTQFETFNRANLYFGAMGGLVTTVNDGSRRYNTIKSPADSASITYVSDYHYSGGIGYSVGIQTGFIYYIVPRLGVNVELAMRYASVVTGDQNFAKDNSRYHFLYFPETIGIRWRF